jgi:hypothetical protein
MRQREKAGSARKRPFASQASRSNAGTVVFYFLFANCSISSRSRLPLALVAVHKVEDLTAEQLTYEEKCFGDYRVGRRAGIGLSWTR